MRLETKGTDQRIHVQYQAVAAEIPMKVQQEMAIAKDKEFEMMSAREMITYLKGTSKRDSTPFQE